MDAFFASVEQRDVPSLRGKPVVVGGQPDSRGVVAACSYEARAFGVRSAMPSAQAYRLCPDAVFVRPRFEAYRDVSQQVRELFAQFTDVVEPASLDEAYLDVSDQVVEDAFFDGSATAIANEIRRRIFDELHLTASAGISYNKFLAKVASDIEKPNGYFVVRPDQAETFIGRLPVGKINGVGAVTEKKMHAQGIFLGADLRRKTLIELCTAFGKAGQHFYNIARGIDNRPVKAHRLRKSLGSEQTLAEDLIDKEDIVRRVMRQAARVESAMSKRQLKAKTITIKFKYSDFSQVTRSKTLMQYQEALSALSLIFEELVDKTEAGMKPIRLIGVSVSGFEMEPSADAEESHYEISNSEQQMGLF